MGEKRPRSFYVLSAVFALYVLFLYGPMIAIYILSFQGPDGGLTFPMNGVSLVWFSKVFAGTGIVDIGAAFVRSLKLGFVVMVLTVVISVSAGLAFRKTFRGASGKEARQLFERQGAVVSRVQRTHLGPITMERTLGRGQFRELTSDELHALLAAPANPDS